MPTGASKNTASGRPHPEQTASAVQAAAHAVANRERAELMQRYFKTGPGEYGEGDVFLGLTVPTSRKIARDFTELPSAELDILIQSPSHEERLIALVIHTAQVKRAAKNSDARRALFAQYDRWLAAGNVNNWDLVDVSAPHVGAYLFSDLQELEALQYLTELSTSHQLWQRRASLLFTFAALNRGNVEPSVAACERLVRDQHDLIQKAVGWVMREVGKRQPETLRAFLTRHAATMPRTSLRYAIEKFDAIERQQWMGLRAASSQLK